MERDRERGSSHGGADSRADPGDRASPDDERTATGAQMRGARASGRTPGLSTAQEPAAAPLGTDDEAAGAQDRSAAMQHEIDRAEQGRGMRGLSAEEAMTGRPGRARPATRAGTVVMALVVLAGLIVLAVFLF